MLYVGHHFKKTSPLRYIFMHIKHACDVLLLLLAILKSLYTLKLLENLATLTPAKLNIERLLCETTYK